MTPTTVRSTKTHFSVLLAIVLILGLLLGSTIGQFVLGICLAIPLVFITAIAIRRILSNFA